MGAEEQRGGCGGRDNRIGGLEEEARDERGKKECKKGEEEWVEERRKK